MPGFGYEGDDAELQKKLRAIQIEKMSYSGPADYTSDPKWQDIQAREQDLKDALANRRRFRQGVGGGQ